MLKEIEKRTPIIKRMVENALEQLMPLGMPDNQKVSGNTLLVSLSDYPEVEPCRFTWLSRLLVSATQSVVDLKTISKAHLCGVYRMVYKLPYTKER